MKNKVLALLILSIISVLTIKAQSQASKKDPAGLWKFEAPYAPEGYTTGTVVVTSASKIYSTSMSFIGNDEKFPGDKVLFDNDSLSFSIYVNGEDVSVSLKMVESAKMSGKAVYSEGVVPLTLTRMPEKK
jgi:hypothetical protein